MRSTLSVYVKFMIFIGNHKKLYDYIKEKHEMFEHLSDENKFIILLKYESKKLAEYLFEAWNLRNSLLFKC